MSPWLSLLGMARKAGKVEIGEDAAAEAVLNHKAKLILVAADAGESTYNRAKRLESDKIPVLKVPEDKMEMGGAVGFASVAVVTLVDLGFASALTKKLAAVSPEAAAAGEILGRKQEKAQRRKADTRKNGRKSSRRNG